MQQPPFPPPPGQPPQFSAYSPSGQELPQPGYPPYAAQPNSGYSFPPSQPKLTGKIALKYGLIFGTIMAAIVLLRYALNLISVYLYHQFYHFISLGMYSILLTVIFTLIYWGVYFCAGIFAARQARQLGAACFACLWASLCFFVVYCLSLTVTILSTLSLLISASSWNSYLIGLASGFAGVFFIQIGLGYGIGVLGGLVGKKLAR
jgi:hypothetical protein